MRLFAPALSIALALVATQASAQSTSTPTSTSDSTSTSTTDSPSLPTWTADLGYRGAFVTDPGMNPFSTHDYFDQVSLGGSRLLVERGRFGFAPGFLWDFGSSMATARGADSALFVHRLSVPLEARFRLTRWLYVFARTAPGVANVHARVSDPSAPAPLVATSWLPTMDLSAGAAWRFADLRDGRFGFWLTADGGYGWAKSMSLDLMPDLASDDPRRVGGTDLGHLALRGAFMRFAVAVSF
jgi:hypothetical protein